MFVARYFTNMTNIYIKLVLNKGTCPLWRVWDYSDQLTGFKSKMDFPWKTFSGSVIWHWCKICMHSCRFGKVFLLFHFLIQCSQLYSINPSEIRVTGSIKRNAGVCIYQTSSPVKCTRENRKGWLQDFLLDNEYRDICYIKCREKTGCFRGQMQSKMNFSQKMDLTLKFWFWSVCDIAMGKQTISCWEVLVRNRNLRVHEPVCINWGKQAIK